MKKIILRALLKLGILKHLNLMSVVVRDGRTFRIPLHGGAGMEFHFEEKEPWMPIVLRRLNDLTGGRGLFVDVGANIGQTLLKLKCLENPWEYIGFEPNPNCLQYLHALAAANGFVKTQFLPFGLSDRFVMSNLSLYSESGVDSGASLVDGFRAYPRMSFSVPSICGDEFLEIFKNLIVVIKLDVEGGELEAIRGLRVIIERDKPFILCEILPVYHRNNMLRLRRQENLEQIFRKLNYAKFRIGLDGTLHRCDEIGVHDSIEDVNYLLCHTARLETFLKTFHVKQ